MVDPPLPPRAGPRPPTHHGMPHTQLGVRPAPEVNAQLFRRAFSLPGVYTPRNLDELEVLWTLVLDAYCYVTGRPRPSTPAVA